MSESEGETGSTYEVRPYETGDREQFLYLYDNVLGKEKSAEWFVWKYEDNPYVDHVPILVAADGEGLVGARSFFALDVAWNGARTTALQPCDTMVHPDHRRRGLFTRMTELAVERYEDDYPFFFNFPNHQSLPGNLKLGWQVVSERESAYRFEDPAAVARARTDRPGVALASKAVTPLVRNYYRLRDRRVSPPAEVAVRRGGDSRASELADLYRAAVPADIHVVRDEQFYEWRLDRPDREYTAYVADGDRGPEAAIVTGTVTSEELATTRLVDVVPLRSPPEPALVALVDELLTDHPGTDMFTAPVQVVPASVLRRFGFHSNGTPPLSLVTDRNTHVARPLGDGPGHGVDITDPDDWLLTLAETDLS